MRAARSTSPSATTPVLAAIGWFQASTKALVGAGGDGEDGQPYRPQQPKPWEIWTISFRLLKDGTRGAEESTSQLSSSELQKADGRFFASELKSQLNEFLLRSVAFSSLRRTHVPAITSNDAVPYSMQVRMLLRGFQIVPNCPSADRTQSLADIGKQLDAQRRGAFLVSSSLLVSCRLAFVLTTFINSSCLKAQCIAGLSTATPHSARIGSA